MSSRAPAEVFPPGEFVKDELEARGWSQVDLAEILGKSPRLVSEVISGKRQITPQTANGLADAFGTDPQFWMNLESAYQLSKVGERDSAVARRAHLYAKLPIKDLLRRGWIQATDSMDALEERVMRFAEVESLEQELRFAHAAKGTTCDEIPPARLAWLFRVRQIARRVVTPKFSSKALREVLPIMRDLLRSPEEVSKVPRMLSEVGVRFVVVEALSGSLIDGTCFWIDSASPVVGMSIRFDRIDNFWFVLRHELEHVLCGHGKERPMIDVIQGDREASADEPEEERVANEASADWCLPKAKVDSWMTRKGPFISEADLLGFSKVQQVHPGIVAGQYRNRTKKYHVFSKYLVKVRSSLVTTAVVDGWGEVYPIS